MGENYNIGLKSIHKKAKKGGTNGDLLVPGGQ
jgi:hypothetical protein